jgi:hypothetical protein
MTQIVHDPKNYYSKIYYEPSNEFEEIRELALQDNNWLRSNYTKENLKIESCNGYAVIFDKNNEPSAMAGVYRSSLYPETVAKQLHRMYVFPKFRNSNLKTLTLGLQCVYQHIILALETANPQFTSYFIPMQVRYKKSSEGYFNVMHRSLSKSDPSWQLGLNYISTCDYDVQKCYQMYIYKGDLSGCKLVDQATWLTLPQGD